MLMIIYELHRGIAGHCTQDAVMQEETHLDQSRWTEFSSLSFGVDGHHVQEVSFFLLIQESHGSSAKENRSWYIVTCPRPM